MKSKCFLCICSVGEESGDSNEEDDEPRRSRSPMVKRCKVDVEMSPGGNDPVTIISQMHAARALDLNIHYHAYVKTKSVKCIFYHIRNIC